MKVFKKKEVITIERVADKKFTIKTSAPLTLTEICDALLGAFCIAARKLVQSGQMHKLVIRQLMLNEFDRCLQEGNHEDI